MHFANVKSAYCFEVNKRANKTQIKNAVQRIYNVKVQKVRTAKVPPQGQTLRHDAELEKSHRFSGSRVPHRFVLIRFYLTGSAEHWIAGH
ncbi:MAG: 50S ribosomal protein L23 [Planctomycetota bacterium]|jgi:ribosomal protein L23